VNAVDAQCSTLARACGAACAPLQVTGHLHVHQPGTYILRWENVASKKPLNLSYQVRE